MVGSFLLPTMLFIYLKIVKKGSLFDEDLSISIFKNLFIYGSLISVPGGRFPAGGR